MSKYGFFILAAFILMSYNAFACESNVEIRLENNRGGFYALKKVTLISKSDGTNYNAVSDNTGTAKFSLPCNTLFDVKISNYTRSFELRSPDQGGTSKQSLSYSPDMAEKAKAFAMTDIEKAELDKFAATLSDTMGFKETLPLSRSKQEYFVKLVLSITDMNHGPLADEVVVFTGVKRNISFKSKTNANGKVLLFLLKGDIYKLHFTLDKEYSSEDCEYSKGITETDISISYMGTREKLRRLKLEADRIAEEEKRLKAEEARFKAWCKKLKISEEEGRKRELLDLDNTTDTVITAVLDRNKWVNKLIVCDVTGSMSPYYSQLSLWFQLNYKREKNMQFVFFNDGDNKSDAGKIIGSTGGIYYTRTGNYDSLNRFMAMVSSKGGGGDCPENNMEALIKGIKMAAPFKELIMIADNYAPVKDISLLKSFNTPVHIILCGAVNTDVMTDYLDIARKTGGSVHTMEEDLFNLSRLSEGQEIEIGGRSYRIMGGKFVAVYKS